MDSVREGRPAGLSDELHVRAQVFGGRGGVVLCKVLAPEWECM